MKRIAQVLVFAMIFSLFSAVPQAYASPSKESKSISLPSEAGKPDVPKTKFTQGKRLGVLKSDEEVLGFAASGLKRLKSDSGHGFSIKQKNKDETGKSHYLLQQSYKGVPVYGHYMQLNLDTEGQVYAVQDKTDSGLSVASEPGEAVLTEEEAAAALKAELEKDLSAPIELESEISKLKYPKPTAKLLYYPYNGNTYLAYEVNMTFIRPEHGNWVGYVDAKTGAVIDKYNKLQHTMDITPTTGTGYGYNGQAKTINITGYDDDTKDGDEFYELWDQTHAGNVVTGSYIYDVYEGNLYATYSETKTFKDTTSVNYYRNAVDAHYNADLVYDFYLNTYGRNSIDGHGMDVISITNVPDEYGSPLDNAFWDGYAMYYGDGSFMDCLSCSLDVVAHELTHGVTQYTADLEYRYQSGALNESISDIMAAVIDKDDWTMGEDTGFIARSLEDPEAYDQPGHMSQYVTLPGDEYHDNGGVHINSGIPNHAAYLMATKFDSLGLKGRSLLGKLTYGALKNYLTPTSDFEDAKNSYLLAAEDLTGVTNDQRTAIINEISEAWREVGFATPVQSLALTGKTVDSATLTWGELAGAASVELQQSENNGVTWTPAATEAALTASSTTAKVINLVTNNAYQFRLVVTGGDYEGFSNVVAVTIDPEPITSLTVGETTGTEVTLSWAAAVGASGLTVEQFTSGSGWTAADTGVLAPDASEATVSGLQAGTAYKFRLQVTGGANAGTSNVVEATTASEAITDLAASGKTSNTVTLTWSAAGNAKSVKVEQSANGGATWAAANTGSLASTAQTATVKKLLPNTQYQFRLVVTGGANNGISNVVDVKTDSVLLTTFAATGKTATTASFKWKAAVGAASLSIEYSTDGGESWTEAETNTLAAKATTATVTGLAPYTEYQFRLVIEGGQNEGSSNTVHVTTMPQPVSSLAASDPTGSSVTLSWTAAIGATGVVVQQSTDGKKWTAANTEALDANAEEAVVSGLLAGTTYKFRLAVTGGANAGFSNIAQATTDSVPITDLVVSKKAATSVTLAWPAAVKAKSVKVEQSTDGVTWTKANTGSVSASAKTATVKKLNPNATYYFRLVVVGGGNDGLSNEVEVSTDPAPITSFAKKSVTATTATFKWKAAVNASDLSIEVSTDGGATWTAAAADGLTASSTTAAVTGLTASTSYKFRLVVTGGANEGTSNVVVIKTTK